MTEHDDDVLTSRLRDALRAEADTVVPRGDGLMRIREAVAGRRSRMWWRAPSTALAAAAVVGIAVGGAFVLNRGGDDGHQVANPTTSVPTPTPSATESSPEPTTSTPATHTYDGVFVYYLHTDGQLGPKLFREKHDRVVAPSAVQAAVQQMLTTPHDPDYTTPWAGDTVDSVSVAGSVATVRLSGSAPATDLDLALQQVAYTVTAALQDASVGVTVLVDGLPVGTTDTTPVTRDPMAQVQATIWITDLDEGQVVSSPLTFHFYGIAFEGQINWEVRGSGGKVRQGFVTGRGDAYSETASEKVTLPPGTYELRAVEFSAKDGSPLHADTKTFTVR
jgi:hypothetical protein